MIFCTHNISSASKAVITKRAKRSRIAHLEEKTNGKTRPSVIISTKPGNLLILRLHVSSGPSH